MSKVNVSVVRETAKAVLVQNVKGEQGWIQKRWLKEGLVSVATFEKAVASFNAHAAEKQNEREWNNTWFPVQILGETEKAIKVSVQLELCHVEQTRFVDVYIPKSQVTNGQVKGWLLLAKAKEASEKYRGHGVIVESVGGVQLNVMGL